MTDLTFNYEKLWYIETRGEGDKVPKRKWGGYSQDFDAAEHVHTHEEIVEHESENWAVCGIRHPENASVSTLIFDIDVHKAPDDFDPDDITVPGDTAVVRSQSGGYHIYFGVHAERGAGAESDFTMTQELGFDIDIRGSYVKHHVVAPAEIPGVGGPYELVNDETIKHVFDPADAASQIRYKDEPLLEYDADTGIGDFEWSRDAEAPDEMPKCYHAGLQLRAAEPDDHPNTHKVNVLTALCGLASGYDLDEMVGHFCDEFAPGEQADVEKTRYQLEHIASHMEAGHYSPPALSTLRDYGILEPGEGCSCDIEYHGHRRPDPANIDWDEVDRAEAILQSETSRTDPAGELEHRNGCYGHTWVKRDDDGDIIAQGFNVATNFTLETESIVDTYEGEILNLKVHPDHPREDPYSVKVHPTVFNESRTFREEVVRGRTTWFARDSNIGTLDDLRQTVGSQNAPRRIGTEFIGLHGDDLYEWVTPNGTLTPDGWKDDAEHVYYPKSSDSNDELESSSVADKYVLSEEDGTEFDRANVANLLEELPWTRNPERGLPVLGWFYSAPLKPIIQDEEGQFNLLQVAGGTGTGKTSTLEMYYQLFGAAPAPFSCDDTRFTIEKRLSGSCGFPIWLDEYKPTDLREDHRKWLHQKFREVFRGASTSKGRPSLGEVLFHFRAPVVFSGEQTVSKPAVRRRTIITQFSSSATSDEYERAYYRVVGASYTDENGETHHPDGYDLKGHALAYFDHILEKPPGEIRAKWRAAREKRDELMAGLETSSLDKSERQGLRTIVFGFEMYREFAEKMGADPADLPGKSELRDAISHVTDNIGPDGRRREHIDDFTELLAQAAMDGYVEEGEHYKVVNSRKYGVEDALAFHMPSCFSAVKKYMRDFAIDTEYSFLARTDYVDNYADKAKEADSYSLATSHKVKGLERGSKTVLIDTERASEALGSSFTLGAFTGETEVDTDEEATPTPISALDGQGNPFHTVTVEVTTWNSVDRENGPAYEGTLTDATGTIELVDWTGCDAFAAEIEEGRHFRIRDVKVSFDSNGTLRLEPVKNTTTAERIQKGVGTTGAADPGDSQQLPSEDSAATDGGSARADADADPATTTPPDAEGRRADLGRLCDILEREGGLLPRGRLQALAAEEHDHMDPERVASVLEYGQKDMGHLTVSDGEVRSLR